MLWAFRLLAMFSVAAHGGKRNFWTNKIRRDAARRSREKMEMEEESEEHDSVASSQASEYGNSVAYGSDWDTESSTSIPEQLVGEPALFGEIYRDEKEQRQSFRQDERIERHLWKRQMENEWSDQTLPIIPIEDTRRFPALLMLAQRNVHPRLRISAELYEVIHQYAGYNELQTLFRMSPTAEHRKVLFGFESWDAMNQRYQTKESKVQYWMRHSVVHIKIDLSLTYLYGNILIIKMTAGGIQDPSSATETDARRSFTCRALGELSHLRILKLFGLGFAVSMDDLQKLPKSLEQLNIEGNQWTTTSGDVDLSLLPHGLERFWAYGCRGMNGFLKLDAPNSSLRQVGVGKTDLRVQLNSVANLPSSLGLFQRCLNVDDAIIQLLKGKGIIVCR